jgi:imidazoleglycerol-phosphate dehydratase
MIGQPPVPAPLGASPMQNGSSATPARTGTIHRVTGETEVRVNLGLDGTGRCRVNTGVPFLDHMLHQISSHGLIDLEIEARGDTHIDDHHTNEDVGIAVGQALAMALADRRGIHRFGHFLAPLDEALVQVALDCSGRPHLSFGLTIPAQKIGSYDTELVKEFFVAVANNAGLTVHIRQLDGVNSHHIVEAGFKAFARALRMAVELDPRRAGAVPSSKGVLERAGAQG